MHTCPKCKTEWEDAILVCPEDGTRLPPPGPAPAPAPAPSQAKRAPAPGQGAKPGPKFAAAFENDGATMMLVAPKKEPPKAAPKAAPPAPPDDGSTMMLVIPKKDPPKAAPKAAPTAPPPAASAKPANPDATMMIVAAPRELPGSKPAPKAAPKAAPTAPPENDGATQMLVIPKKDLPKATPKAAPTAPAENDGATQMLAMPKRDAAPKAAPRAAPTAPPDPPPAARPVPPAVVVAEERAPAIIVDDPPPDEEEPYDELIGQQFGSYRVVRLLGQGGMGAVYLAEHPVIKSRVAIKVLHPQFADNKKVVDRFFNEARAVNLIGHDNILKILDLNSTEDGRPYFIMELLEGQSLQALVEPGLPVPLIVSGPILLQFCEALQAAHDRKIYHRDVKPDNVYLISHKGRKNFVKVVDFGIAKLTEQATGGSGTTQTGMVVGTPAYMSPEQAAGVHNKIDGRSDVYSTGVMMFQLATGKLPFPSANFGEVLIGHMRLDPPKPRDLNPEIPLEYEHIILTALAKEQDARQQSMRELELQIAEVMHGLQISKELPIADDIAQSPDMVRLMQQDGPLGARKRAERPKFREAEISKKASSPLKKSGQTLATRLAPAPTAIQENPQRRVAPLPPKPNPLRLVALGLGGVVLLAVVVIGSVTIFSSADPLHRKARKKKVASVSDTQAPAADEPIGPTLLSVVSDPLGANVAATWKDGGNRSGPTPLDIRVPRDTKVTLVFSMPGFSPYRQDVIADESQVVTAVMQKDGSGHTKVTRRPKNNEDVIDVEDQLKAP